MTIRRCEKGLWRWFVRHFGDGCWFVHLGPVEVRRP